MRRPVFPASTLAVFALYLACTVLLAWPLVLNIASSAMPGDPDTDLFVWTLAWNTHALTSAPWSIFESNIYYPERLTLAFSENLIGSTIFAAPVLWLTGDYVVMLNVTELISIPLSALGAFVLGRRLGFSVPAAILCGMFFAFAPARFFRVGQMHLTTIQWMPFCLAFLHAYLDGGRRRDLRLALVFFTLQTLASGHAAVLLAVAVVALLAYRVARGMPIAFGRRLRDVGVPGVLALIPAALLYVPYSRLQRDIDLRRTLQDWDTAPQSFLSSVSPLHQHVFAWTTGRDFTDGATAHLFPGFTVLLLALIAAGTGIAALVERRGAARLVATTLTIVGAAAATVAAYVFIWGHMRLRTIEGALVFTARDPWRPLLLAALAAGGRLALWRRVPPARPFGSAQPEAAARQHLTFYALLALLCVLLSLGPPLSLWPLVYDLPGFSFIRAHSRFMLLGMLALAVLGGGGFDRLTARWGAGARRTAAVVLGVIVLAECYTVPLPAHRSYSVQIPAADRWLATEPRPFVVAEVPANHHNDRLHSTYMLHSMAHWQKTVHGHSGIRTPWHLDFYSQLQDFPSAATLRRLADAGVTHVVVHPWLYAEEDWREVEAGLVTAEGLELAFDDGRDRVYRLRLRSEQDEEGGGASPHDLLGPEPQSSNPHNRMPNMTATTRVRTRKPPSRSRLTGVSPHQ
jgi:hypothetical protein